MGSRAKAFPSGYQAQAQAQAQAGKQAWFLGVLSGLVMIVIARSFFWPGNFKPSLHWLELYSVQCTASSLHPIRDGYIHSKTTRASPSTGVIQVNWTYFPLRPSLHLSNIDNRLLKVFFKDGSLVHSTLGLIFGLCCQSESLVKRFSESKTGVLRSFHFLRLCHISHVTMSSHAAVLLMHCAVCAPWLDTPDPASPSMKPLGAGA
ncbi:hypothetical protein DER44DRAFT_790419 [Fusarium oxysporum]|nr:hypothetical protein DER44DRAFT_790419 [Fusarium oxysporum]